MLVVNAEERRSTKSHQASKNDLVRVDWCGFVDRVFSSVQYPGPSAMSLGHSKSTTPFRLVPLNKPDRRGQKTKLFAHTVLEMPHKGKVKARFTAGSEYHKGRRTNANLR